MPPTDKPAPRNPQADASVSPPVDTSVSRREFARRAAIGTAALLAYPNLDGALPTATVSSDSVSLLATRHSSLSDSPSQTPTDAPKLSPQSQAEADSRYQAILAQYSDRFSDAQKTDLKRLCLMLQPPLDRLRSYIAV